VKLEVWGLGHIGLVCAASLAHRGHQVIGVDMDPLRVARVNAGEAYISEPDLPARVAAGVAAGRLVGALPADLDPELPDASILCVPTPAGPDGTLASRHVVEAATQIAQRLRAGGRFHTVIVRSTVPVHFTGKALRPLLEAQSGRQAGVDFGLAVVPEFLREGHALRDFDNPSLVVLGTDDPASRDSLRPLFEDPRCPGQHVSTAVAEFFKLTNNAFHALKVGFANEIARLAHGLGIDGHEVMRVLCQDARLNLSSAYLAPGFAFGGACLGKDLDALRSLAAASEAPILAAISASNHAHLDACLRAIRARQWRRLGIHGVTNKAGTDDLRNSPVLALISALQPKPGTLWIFDPDLRSDQVPLLQERYGAQVVGSLPELQRRVDLVIDFRNTSPYPAASTHLDFARFWDGGAGASRNPDIPV
jgi:GDP-mannose 6-dehydrogenase